MGIKWRYVSTIFLAIFCGDMPLHRPYIYRPYIYIYGRYLRFRFLLHGHWLYVLQTMGLSIGLSCRISPNAILGIFPLYSYHVRLYSYKYSFQNCPSKHRWAGLVYHLPTGWLSWEASINPAGGKRTSIWIWRNDKNSHTWKKATPLGSLLFRTFFQAIWGFPDSSYWSFLQWGCYDLSRWTAHAWLRNIIDHWS